MNLLPPFTHEDGGRKSLRNNGNDPSLYMASHPRRHESNIIIEFNKNLNSFF
jgi:hypothetical protein